MKLRNSLLTISLVFILSNLFSQHLIILNNDETIKASEVEVLADKIKYKKQINPDGPFYVIDKDRVAIIDYENANAEIISPLGAEKNKKMITNVEAPLNKDFKRNIFAYHLFDVIFNDFTLSYERLSKNGMLGYQIPLGFGFRKQTYYNSNNNNSDNTIYTGISLKYYPAGQGVFKYYVGPELRIGYLIDNHYESQWDDTEQKYYDVYIEKQSPYTKLFIRNGVVFLPVDNLSIGMNFGLGMKYYTIFDRVVKTAHFAVNLGYRF
ncbi:MAG: hypothetical protein U9R42_09455 [Bacteroidota bacterium]|nr:hypothetical protein [Bacteroidota bacterium]